MRKIFIIILVFLIPVVLLSIFDFNQKYTPAASAAIEYMKAKNRSCCFINYLNALNKDEIIVVAKWMEKNSNKIPPICFSIFSDKIFEIDKEKAILFYFIGRIRTTQDVQMCNDKSASAQLAIFPMFAPKTLNYIAQNEKIMRTIAPKVVLWDVLHFARMSPKWSCYHGVQAFLKEPELKNAFEYYKIQFNTRKSFLKAMFST